MTSEAAAAADGVHRPTVDEVLQFLAGAGASGLWLAGLVRVAAGHARNAFGLSSIWISLLGAAVFLWRGNHRPARPERLAEVATGVAFLVGAASFAVQAHSVQMLAQDLWLGVWGGFAVVRLRAVMPAAMSRAGLAIGLATASFGLIPGLWGWVSLGSLVVIVLVAVWLLDNLEAEGRVLKRRERPRE